ncbi:hypothetical protein STP4a_197 [Salmonella phage STP4-a]|uniref:Uncharacterized protein n=1 Tax=Salmonella phage STP4-a TaxID=1445860 RepID=A0A0B4L933_9CAUD|nr:hypothetical protein STP4a_197 [Salmonella phage STP4-a]AHJ86794.1 hypothetical protein STP4a_197 [Salmonella phage STP4-a]
MDFTNFRRKYVQNNGWDISTTLLWEHNNGTVAQIDMYWEDNYVFISFENGLTLDVQFNGSEIKVGFHDEIFRRDLSTHPSWKTNRALLVKLYLRRAIGKRATEEQLEALWDVVANEIEF